MGVGGSLAPITDFKMPEILNYILLENALGFQGLGQRVAKAQTLESIEDSTTNLGILGNCVETH